MLNSKASQWLLILACMAGAAVLALIRLQLAAGYGFDVFGWRPPHSSKFQTASAVAFLAALVLYVALCFAVVAYGVGAPRIVAVVLILPGALVLIQQILKLVALALS